ncbi:MAG: Tol-Pal system subunit TolQ [Thermodesulfobacteria bacterium]|nr:Tol-Pal system subunit TolQ [Thermodesulfobacteriota bacterium]
MNLIVLVLQAGPVAKFTMLILLAISVVTWAVIFIKWREFRRAEAGLSELTLAAERLGSLGDFAAKIKKFRHLPGGELARALLVEVARLRAEGLLPQEKSLFALWLEMFIKRLSRYLGIVRERELLKLRRYLAFLAVAGNSSPFIGLFGTVWGIMSAFHRIGLKGSASLATVAPGIAEALVATALGLFAAIPAAMAYNFFVARLERVEARLTELGELILLLVEREFMREVHGELVKEETVE